MKNILNHVTLFIMVIIFSGCVSNYNIEPNYDSKTQILLIGDVLLAGYSKEIKTQNELFYDAKINLKKNIYKSNNSTCSNITFMHKVSSQNNLIYSQLKKNFKGQCDVLKINNLNFFTCNKYYLPAYSTKYYISSSTINKGNVSILKVEKKCFNLLYDNFEKKANIDNIQIENSQFKKTKYSSYYFHENGMHKNTGTRYDSFGYDVYNIHKDTGTQYNKEGYDKFDFDKNGYNSLGFNNKKNHKSTGTKYNKDGLDIFGYNKFGFDINGLNKDTRTKFDKAGYDINGLNILGKKKI